MRSSRLALLSMFATAVAPSATLSQRVAVVALQPPNGSLDEEFTLLTSVRELSDGRVLVTDPRDKLLVVADFRSGSVEQIGGRGRGPNEYQIAAVLYRLRGDSSLMPDLMSRRWLILDGARIVGMAPPQDPMITATQGFFVGVDQQWNFLQYKQEPPHQGVREVGKGDSLTMQLVPRRTLQAEPVVRLREAPARRETTLGADGKISSSSYRRHPLTVGEEAFLFPDGWLAVVRIEPFRVDWRTPDGQWVRGAPLPVPVIRMSNREIQASIARTRESDPKAISPGVQYGWPDVMPPFSSGGFVADPGGRLLILRQRSADFPKTRYFVVDRQGKLEGEIEMPLNEKIIGFGRSSVYVVVTDVDGIQRLRRHPWPAPTPVKP
jgi:hypothetical protein